MVTTVKWFWFLFGMAMFLPVVYSLARTFRETVITRKDAEIIELYGKVAWLTIIIWSFYPIVWLFSEGFASFSVSFEVRIFLQPHMMRKKGNVFGILFVFHTMCSIIFLKCYKHDHVQMKTSPLVSRPNQAFMIDHPLLV